MSNDKKSSITDKIKIAFEVVTISIALCTTVISGRTLHEMEQERNLIYMPEVLINAASETITYFPDEQEAGQDIKWVTGTNISVSLNEFNELADRSEYSITELHSKGIDSLTELPIANVTDGTAIDIKCKWDLENIERLSTILADNNPVWKDSLFKLENEDFYHYMYSAKRGLDFSVQNEKKFAYLIKGSEENTTIKFPLLYSLLISRIYAENQSQELDDIIKMSLDYSDIQGNTYTMEVSFDISILINREFFKDSGNSHGKLYSYSIVPKVKKLS